MLKRAVLATVVALAALTATTTPAQAFPPGDNLIVVTYYQGGTVVGQKWWGCPGQPPGQWGTQTQSSRLHLVPC